MNWVKLFRHDLRSGLLRWRYLFVPLLFVLPCFMGWTDMHNAKCVGSWMDYILCCFEGIPPILNMEDFTFPIQWFLVMGGCLFFNLDYPLNDLTEAGQQVIIRSVSKKSWFLSKCVWNLLSCVVYILLGMLTALIFAVCSGGSTDLSVTPKVCEYVLQIYCTGVLSVGQLLAAVGLALLTLVALNLLQMVLCLMMKPVFSFLICICLLIMSLLINSPYVLGNGAIMVRSGILMEGGLDPVVTGLTCLAVISASIVGGIIRFDHMDHLRYEG